MFFRSQVVIMWDDCQEEWDHSVPRQADSSIGKHPVAGAVTFLKRAGGLGLVRLSLTFRMARPELAGHKQLCRCGRPCVLKSKAGRYFMACSPIGSLGWN